MLWGGLLNLSTRIGAATKLSFNNTYTRGADNEATDLSGLQRGVRARPSTSPGSTYIERRVRSNQLSGEHLLGQRHFVSTGR